MANPILSDGQASPQSIYSELGVAATNQTRAEGHHPVGTRGYLPDGRVFYYCSNSSVALTVGSLLAVPATIGLNRTANHDKIVLTTCYANLAAGVSKFNFAEADLDTDDIIENEYKDGYLWFENTAGQGGYLYKIKAHDRIDASGSATTRKIELFDALIGTAVATDEISFARNRHDRVIASSTSSAEASVGVAPRAVTVSTALATDVTTTEAATTTYFFWAQTWGPAAVTSETGVLAGTAVISSTTAKRVLPSISASVIQLDIGVGLASDVAAGGDFALVDLRICP